MYQIIQNFIIFILFNNAIFLKIVKPVALNNLQNLLKNQLTSFQSEINDHYTNFNHDSSLFSLFSRTS